MRKHLSFLIINDSPRLYVDDYIQHLYHPFKIVCQQEDTHLDLFKKLKAEWFDNPEALKAVEEWIAYQYKCEKPEVFERLVTDGWKDKPDGEFYAWFDLQDKRD